MLRSPLSRVLGSPGLLALLLVTALAGAAAAEVVMPPSLKVEEGEAQLRAPGDNQTWRTARPGQVVDFGLVVSTNASFKGSINYADGTTLTLKPSTMLQVLSDGLRLYRGQAWIKVTKRGRGFTCVMPAAIASVRGTRFSCEVPSYARVFSRRYVNEFFNRAHLASSGLRGHLVSGSIGLALLSGLVADAPGGKVPSSVKVFEGRVMVVYPAYTGAIKQTWMVTAGEKVDTTIGERAVKEPLASADYARWSEPLPRSLSGQGPLPAGRAAPFGEDLPDPMERNAAPVRDLKLLGAGHERR